MDNGFRNEIVAVAWVSRCLNAEALTVRSGERGLSEKQS